MQIFKEQQLRMDSFDPKVYSNIPPLVHLSIPNSYDKIIN